MTFQLKIKREDANRGDLVTALEHVISQLKSTDLWRGLAKSKGRDYDTNWEAKQ